MCVPLFHRGSWCTVLRMKFQEWTRRMVCFTTARSCLNLALFSFLLYGWSSWDSRRGWEYLGSPRKWQSQGSNPEKGVDRKQDDPISSLGCFSWGSPGLLFQGSSTTPPPVSTPTLHLSSQCHSHWFWLSPCPPLQPDLDLRPSYGGGKHQFKSWPCDILSWWTWEHFLISQSLVSPCKMGMIIIYLILWS